MENGNLSVYLSHNPNAPRLPLVKSYKLVSRVMTDSHQLLDVATGLEYLHAMQPTIVHGDLKSVRIYLCGLSGRPS